MATYATSASASNQIFTPPGGGVVGIREATFEATTALAAADVIQMISIGANERVVGLQLFSDDMDSGTTLVFDVGDGVDPDRYIDGSVIGRAGGFAELGAGVAAGSVFNMDYTYSADDTIDVTIAAGPAGNGLGTIKLRAFIVAK